MNSSRLIQYTLVTVLTALYCADIHAVNAWAISPDGVGKWQFLNSSDVNVADLRFGDFNNDGIADVFTTGGGNWFVSFGGTSSWQTINTSNVSVSNVRLADFNADGAIDVFASWGGLWRVSFGGTGPWQVINSSNVGVNNLKLADFNNDGNADVFASWGGKWRVSFGGTGSWQIINTSNVPVADVRLADFNADGKADVFASWGGKWRVSFGGTGPWQVINSSAFGVSNLKIADFDNDNRADVFTTSGGKWRVSFGGTAPWQDLNSSSVTIGQIALADFDNNGRSEVFANFNSVEHFLEVSRHNNANITNGQADAILARATFILRNNDGGEDVACFLRMRRAGNVSTFNVGNGTINSNADFNAVIALRGRVKVVNQINFCNNIQPNIIGCAPIGGDSFAVVRVTPRPNEGILWAHEFGHNQGLGDLTTPNRVMNGTIAGGNNRVTQTECKAFRTPLN